MNNYLVKTSSLSRYLNEINRFKLLSKDEEYDLAMRYRNSGDITAAHALVTSNLRFVVKIANQYRNYGIKLRDLIQEGNIGLMRAVKSFDPQKGFRLISYAVWWIKAYIQKFILESYSLVKMGTTQLQRKLFTSLSRIRRKLTSMDGVEPTDAEIASELGADEREVAEMKNRIALKDSSLDKTVAEDSSTTHLDLLESENANQEDIVSNAEEQKKVSSLLKPFIAKLKEKEKVIVNQRLLAEEPTTLQEIGDRYRISRERVRQIEERVKDKIKGYLLEKGISPRS